MTDFVSAPLGLWVLEAIRLTGFIAPDPSRVYDAHNTLACPGLPFLEDADFVLVGSESVSGRGLSVPEVRDVLLRLIPSDKFLHHRIHCGDNSNTVAHPSGSFGQNGSWFLLANAAIGPNKALPPDAEFL
ncbi:hypothetical protein TNIN_13221 [Trichonephila inaurata madagascariensis]|uniref:Uncharacterized protein n=1 Tax=Trichonephila inaurata madagascariensis TaxID=2747483 RepID=A0A8X6YR30_9ARAC|nr:hypothetical protein TNIN_13221 [Trichonephila inaurata madagascariensis]